MLLKEKMDFRLFSVSARGGGGEQLLDIFSAVNL